MTSKFRAPAVVVGLCVIAFYVGRTYRAPGHTAPLSSIASSPPRSHFVAPPDFGITIYRDISTLSFAELYEALRDAPSSTRVEWLRQIRETSEGPKKVAAICAFFRALVQADPNAATDLILQLGRHRAPAIHHMVYAAPPSAMPRLAETLLKLPHAARDFDLTPHLEVALDEWAQVDPEAVLRFVEQNKKKHDDDEEGLSLEAYCASIVHAWAGIDHEAALTWIETQPGEISDMVRESWVSGWFEADRDAAIGYALAHLEDERMVDALSTFGSTLFDESETTAVKYVQKLPSPEIRRNTLQLIAHQVGPNDSDYPPDKVAKFLVEFPVAEWPDNSGEVIERWLRLEPNESVGWISRQPPEVQTNLIKRFPVPDIEFPEPEVNLRPMLDLPPSEFRTKLLQRVVPQLPKSDLMREAVEEMKISPTYKAELRALLWPDDGKVTVSPDPEEAR